MSQGFREALPPGRWWQATPASIFQQPQMALNSETGHAPTAVVGPPAAVGFTRRRSMFMPILVVIRTFLAGATVSAKGLDQLAA